MSQWTRRSLLAGVAGAGGASAIAAALSGDDDGTLSGGTMALEDAYNVAGDLWIGPDSAKDSVTPSDGAVFMAVDTQVEYYGDGEAWDGPMGVGSEEQPVPEGHFESHSTEVLNNIVHATDDSATTSEIQSGLDSYAGDYLGPAKLPNGLFEGLSTISLQGRNQLQGAGIESTVLEPADSLDANLVEYVVPDGKTQYFAALQDLKLLGNKANNASGHGVYLNGEGSGESNDFHAENLFIHLFAGDGFHADFTWGHNLRNVLIETCDGAGLVMENGGQFDIDGAFIAYNAGRGLDIGARQGAISNVEVRQNGAAGANISNARNQLTNIFGNQNDQHGVVISGNECTATNIHARNNGQESAGYAGVVLSGNDCVLIGGSAMDNQGTKTQTNGLRVDGDRCVVNGFVAKENAGVNDIVVTGGECVLQNVMYGVLNDNGTRTIANGRGTNSGNPATSGEWNGHADFAAKHDATIYDTSATAPYPAYVANEDGSTWEQDSRTAA